MALIKRNRYILAGKLVPHLPFILLGLLSVFLYKERLFSDSGYYLFNALNSGSFRIEHDRYVLAISQLLPLAGVWLGFNLKTIILLYSIGHVLFFYVLFLFVYFGLGDRKSGLMLILLQTVGILQSFFTPQFELYYGIALLITFYAIFRQGIRGLFAIVLMIVLEFFALTSHPLVFMLFAFIILFDIQRKEPRDWKLYVLFALIFGGVIYFKFMTFSDYEQGKVNWHLNYTENKLYLNLLSPEYLQKLGFFLLRFYTEVLLLWIIGILMLLRKKAFIKALMVIFAFTGYVAMVNAAYNGTEYSRYIEQVYFPLAFIALVPVVYSYPRSARPGLNNIVFLSLAGLILFRIVMIYNASKPFILRTHQMENMIASARQMSGSKFIASENQFERPYSITDWSYPLESLLLSACDGKYSAVTIAPQADIKFNQNYKLLRPYNLLFRKWEIYNYSWLNNDYFMLKPGPYQPLCDSLAPPNDYQYLISNITIKINPGTYYKAFDTVYIPVTIRNLSDTPLRCNAGDRISLSYFWIRNKEMVDWDGLHTPLETDVYQNLTQNMAVATPSRKGRYQLMVDIKVENKIWFGLTAQANMLIY